MRTPDSDETQGTETQGGEGTETFGAGGGGASLLADGFGGSDPSEGGDDGGDGAFGAGSDDDNAPEEAFASEEPSFLQGGTEDTSGVGGTDGFEAAGDELSAFEFESDYVPDTDSDWDITGDGVVDHHDAHEAMTGFHDFHVDDSDSHGHAQNEGFFDHE